MSVSKTKTSFGYYKGGNLKKQNTSNISSSRESVKSILQYPYADIPERKVRKEICELFNVRMAVSEEDATPSAVYFPYYSKQGKLSGWMRSDLTLDKMDDNYWTAIGKVGVDCLLFGQHIAEKIERPKKALFVAEGQWDVLSVYQSVVDSLKGTKFEWMQPFVVGPPCGTGSAADAFVSNMQFVSQFEKIILGFDSDEATDKQKQKGMKKGKEATEDVAACLMSDNIYCVKYPEPHKDASDMLQHGLSSELSNLFKFCKDKFVAEKIITSSTISLEDVTKKRTIGIMLPSFPRLMKKIRGLRKRELVVITGPSGFGKSTVSSRMAYDLARADQRVGMIFLEEEVTETIQRMMAAYLKVNYNNFKDNPKDYATQEQLEEAKNWCDNDDRFVFLSHFGSIMIETLMNKIKTLVFMNKVDFILLDHLSMCVSGLAVTDERKLLDMIMTELAAFCASHDVGIIAVSHLNRGVDQEFKPPKGKEDEPFWVPVRKEQMRGSAALEQLSWIVIGAEPEIMPDRTRGRLRLVVLKNRPWSYLGVADVVKMNDTTGELDQADYDIID